MAVTGRSDRTPGEGPLGVALGLTDDDLVDATRKVRL